MLATLVFLRHELALGFIEPSPRAGVNGRDRGQEDRLHLQNNRFSGGDISIPHVRLYCLPVWGYTQCFSNGHVREAQPLDKVLEYALGRSRHIAGGCRGQGTCKCG